jgi:hypothetical protein
MSATGFAATVIVSNDTGDLGNVAADMTAALLSSELVPLDVGDGQFALEAFYIHCSERSHTNWDSANPLAGLRTVVCRMNSEEGVDTKKGQVLADGQVLVDLLVKIQSSPNNGGVRFRDCAMGGYCGTFLKSIRCTINTLVEVSVRGRWSCVLVDGQ